MHRYISASYTLSPNHKYFLKDGSSVGRSTSFFVVFDDQGLEWLLKEPAGSNIHESETARRNRVWREGVREVYAANLANYLGYPAASAKLVLATIDGVDVVERPFVALSYLGRVTDVKRNIPEEFFPSVSNVKNQHDITFRPVLNWLLGSHTDYGRQGVVDADEKYYAIDMTVSTAIYKPHSSHYGIENTNYASIIKSASCDENIYLNLGVCMGRFIDKSNAELFHNYFSKISELAKSHKVAEMLRPDDKMKQDLVAAIAERAKAITYLYENDGFTDSSR